MYKTISIAALAALIILAIGCDTLSQASAGEAADTLTRRQKNEIIADLPIPGARGLGNALDVSDLAAARARVMDSIAGVR